MKMTQYCYSPTKNASVRLDLSLLLESHRYPMLVWGCPGWVTTIVVIGITNEYCSKYVLHVTYSKLENYSNGTNTILKL